MGDRLSKEYCITPGIAKGLLDAHTVEVHSFTPREPSHLAAPGIVVALCTQWYLGGRKV